MFETDTRLVDDYINLKADGSRDVVISHPFFCNNISLLSILMESGTKYKVTLYCGISIITTGYTDGNNLLKSEVAHFNTVTSQSLFMVVHDISANETSFTITTFRVPYKRVPSSGMIQSPWGEDNMLCYMSGFCCLLRSEYYNKLSLERITDHVWQSTSVTDQYCATDAVMMLTLLDHDKSVILEDLMLPIVNKRVCLYGVSDGLCHMWFTVSKDVKLDDLHVVIEFDMKTAFQHVVPKLELKHGACYLTDYEDYRVLATPITNKVIITIIGAEPEGKFFLSRATAGIKVREIMSFCREPYCLKETTVVDNI